MADIPADPEILRLAAQVVSAHVAHNAVAPDELPALINAVWEALKNLSTEPSELIALRPAVPINKSVFPDYIVCLEDGKKLSMLKRHLATEHEMTPDQYRIRWRLPKDYPMTAPNYAARRSELAKTSGLGRKASAPPPARKFPEGVRGKKGSGAASKGA